MSKHHSNTNLAVALTVAVLTWAIGPTGVRSQAAQPGHEHAAPLAFEAVYRPKETRLYLYGPDHRPISAKGVQGTIAMKVRGQDKVYPFPLAYVAPQAGSASGDYLAATVDVSRIRDGDMTVTFELANLPNSGQPQAAFTQTFALSKLDVAVAPLDDSDRAGIDRQKGCVVAGGKLGAMGTPVKVLVGDQPVYLCCKGCVGKVQKNPNLYLAKAAELRAGR